MFEYLFNTTFNVSIAEMAVFFLLGTFVATLVFFGILYWIGMRAPMQAPAVVQVVPEPPPMSVIPANGRQLEDEPGVPPGPGWRRNRELEAAPLAGFARLPECPSLGFKGWNLEDPDRTQIWTVRGGVDALDLDPGPEPSVDPNTRRRFIRTDAEMSALAVAQGFEGKEQRRPFATVDAALAEAAERLSKRKTKAEVSA